MGLDAVELMMAVEDAFDTEISSELAEELPTVGDLFEYIEAIKSEKGPVNGNKIWIVLQSIIVNLFAVDIHEVTPEARFVQDLGIEWLPKTGNEKKRSEQYSDLQFRF